MILVRSGFNYTVASANLTVRHIDYVLFRMDEFYYESSGQVINYNNLQRWEL